MKWICDIPASANGKILPWARAWRNMKERCYSKKLHARRPTYIGSHVCTAWHKASNFKSWYDWHHVEGYHLDKDLLSRHKYYSPETCCYIPGWLNSLLTDSGGSRGDLPQGVSRHGSGYKARIMVDGKPKRLGFFLSVEDAFIEYVIAKREYVLSKKPLVLELPRGDEIWEGVVRILADQIAAGFEMIDPKCVRCSERL